MIALRIALDTGYLVAGMWVLAWAVILAAPSALVWVAARRRGAKR